MPAIIDNPFNSIILPLVERYPEVKWFADEKVAATKEAPVKDQGKGWTHLLAETTDLPTTPFITIPKSGGKYVELERMLSSIVFFYWFKDGSQEAYQKFTALQNANEKLSWESFQEIHQLAMKVTPDNSHTNAIEAMLVFSDTGKTPIAKTHAKNIELDKADHDDFIETMLHLPANDIQKILPSFANLTPENQRWLAQISGATPIHWGHAFHVEGGVGMYSRFEKAVRTQKVTMELLDAAYLIHLCDVAAAQQQQVDITKEINNKGSVSLTESSYQGYRLIRKTLGKMVHDGLSAKEALDENVQSRATLLKANLEGPSTEFLIRIAGWLRLSDPNDYELLKKAFDHLHHSDQLLALEQFDIHAGFNLWNRNPTYGPAVLLNLADFQNPKEVKAVKIARALEGACCLAHLFKYIAAKVEKSETPVNLNEIAGIAAKHPELFQLKKFNPSDFELDENNKIIFKGTLSATLNPPPLPLTWDKDRKDNEISISTSTTSFSKTKIKQSLEN